MAHKPFADEVVPDVLSIGGCICISREEYESAINLVGLIQVRVDAIADAIARVTHQEAEKRGWKRGG
jgi:hypothetical protein